jgi:hypothetical protein
MVEKSNVRSEKILGCRVWERLALRTCRACRTQMVNRFASSLTETNFTCSVAFSLRILVWLGVSSPVLTPFTSLKTQLACTSMRQSKSVLYKPSLPLAIRLSLDF